MDILFIEKWTIMTMIGIHHWEKRCFQKLVFDLYLAYNGRSSLFKKSALFYLDYSKVEFVIINLLKDKHFNLIEDVAEVVAQTLIERFLICWVKVKVSKPNVINNAINVGVCITRRR